MQADGLQQLLERLTHIFIIIDNEYGWHILRAHNDAPQSQERLNQNVASFILSSPFKRRLITPDRLYRNDAIRKAAQRLEDEVGLEDDWRPLTLTRFACLPA